MVEFNPNAIFIILAELKTATETADSMGRMGPVKSIYRFIMNV